MDNWRHVIYILSLCGVFESKAQLISKCEEFNECNRFLTNNLSEEPLIVCRIILSYIPCVQRVLQICPDLDRDEVDEYLTFATESYNSSNCAEILKEITTSAEPINATLGTTKDDVPTTKSTEILTQYISPSQYLGTETPTRQTLTLTPSLHTTTGSDVESSSTTTLHPLSPSTSSENPHVTTRQDHYTTSQALTLILTKSMGQASTMLSNIRDDSTIGQGVTSHKTTLPKNTETSSEDGRIAKRTKKYLTSTANIRSSSTEPDMTLPGSSKQKLSTSWVSFKPVSSIKQRFSSSFTARNSVSRITKETITFSPTSDITTQEIDVDDNEIMMSGGSQINGGIVGLLIAIACLS